MLAMFGGPYRKILSTPCEGQMVAEQIRGNTGASKNTSVGRWWGTLSSTVQKNRVGAISVKDYSRQMCEVIHP